MIAVHAYRIVYLSITLIPSLPCLFVLSVSALRCAAPALQAPPPAGPSPMQESCPDHYVHGASCTVSCTHGHRLQGRSTITCERDDRTHPPKMTWGWSGSDSVKPQCKGLFHFTVFLKVLSQVLSVGFNEYDDGQHLYY